jgi:hypothetical protein
MRYGRETGNGSRAKSKKQKPMPRRGFLVYAVRPIRVRNI